MTSYKSGDFDPAFGVNGRLDIRTPGNLFNLLSGITTDATGRLVIYGKYVRAGSPPAGRPGVARLTNEGTIDTRFGDQQDGLTTAPKRIEAQSAHEPAYMADGSFFITASPSEQLPIVHYSEDGLFIKDWVLSEGQSISTPCLLATVDDKLLIASGAPKGGVIHRRNNDGSVDSNFGQNGKVDFLPDERYIVVLDMARSAVKERFYLAVTTSTPAYILRVDTDGLPDNDFADNGAYPIEMPGATVNFCNAVTELSSGKVLALVTSGGAEGGPLRLFCLTHQGRPDTTFNGGNPLLVPGDVGEAIAEQADGKILVVHRGNIIGQRLSRYLASGLPDPDFGNNGTVTFTNEQMSFIKGVTLQPDGKIVVAGAWGSITTVFRLLP